MSTCHHLRKKFSELPSLHLSWIFSGTWSSKTRIQTACSLYKKRSVLSFPLCKSLPIAMEEPTILPGFHSTPTLSGGFPASYDGLPKSTLPEARIAPENRHFQKERIVFQPSKFRYYMSFREGSPYMAIKMGYFFCPQKGRLLVPERGYQIIISVEVLKNH